EPQRQHRAPDGGDRHLARPHPGRHRRRAPADRGGLLRPHARPARAPRSSRPGRDRHGRPGHRLPPHRRGHRDRAGPGDRRRPRRPLRHHALRTRGRPDGRGPRQLRARHLRARPLRLRRGAASARRHRRLRARARRGVLPGGGRRGAHDAAPADRGRHQRPPHDRGLLQGLRASPAAGGQPRSRAERRALDQGNPHRM
ncbi:MAG: Imidazoleglycerol-phosphate dehydratase, partial [uncultured Solirubrobacteraceae bacterium]